MGNKIDLHEKREINTEMGQKKAEELKILFYETSALSNDENCVHKAFDKLIDIVMEKHLKVLKDQDDKIIRKIRCSVLKLKAKNLSPPKKKCCG